MRSAMIDSMSNEEHLIHELMRSMLPGPLFTKFCEAREISLNQMNIIATDYKTAVKLAAKNSGPQSISAKVAKEDPKTDEPAEALKVGGPSDQRKIYPNYTCLRCGGAP